jgi:hypothetical protein
LTGAGHWSEFDVIRVGSPAGGRAALETERAHAENVAALRSNEPSLVEYAILGGWGFAQRGPLFLGRVAGALPKPELDAFIDRYV